MTLPNPEVTRLLLSVPGPKVLTHPNAFVDAIRNGDPRALQAVDRLLHDMRHVDDITDRELELLQHLANGKTTKQAAKAMWMQQDSAYKSLKRICPKLGAANKTHAVAIALREGMIA